jgi:hypothetical protein
MTAVRERLSDETRARLRELAAAAEAVEWPGVVARYEGWAAANRQYQARQRAQGEAEMVAVLDALALQLPLGPDAVAEALLTAIAVYLHTDGIAATVERSSDGLVLDVHRCPIYDHFADPTWRGVTACGCFARRLGWYDALGIPRDEDLVLNRKWDDPVCRTAIHLPLPGA